MMNVTGVQVRIYDEGKCIHEREIVRSEEESDLRTLTRDLRDVQSEVNDFLTALIQRRDASDGAREMTNPSNTSDEDEEEEEEEEEVEEEGETRANPKKCKLSI